MTPKLMSREELSAALKVIGGGTFAQAEEATSAVLAHIAALEASLVEAKRTADSFILEAGSSAKAAEEWGRLFREEAKKREAAEADNAVLCVAATKASAELRHTYRPETRDWNLVARAIALLEKATTPDHPGAALLEEHRKDVETLKADNAAWKQAVSAVLNFVQCHSPDMGGDHKYVLLRGHGRALAHLQQLESVEHPGSGLLEEHRKARIRARNEGREHAAANCDARATASEADGLMDQAGIFHRAANIIRALKEPEHES